MKTRRQSKRGGTRRGGFYSQLNAITGNIANGGGRIAQVNEIINLGDKEQFRKLKRALIVLSGGNINDNKYKHLHVLPNDPESNAEKPVDKETLAKVTEETAKAVEQGDEKKPQGGRKNKRNRI
jgi:hypothetical protein